MLSNLMTRLRALLRKSEVERELDEELRYHIEQQAEQNIRLGMNPEEARQAALKSCGGVEQAKERSRDTRGVRWIEDFWQDLRYGARMLMKNPGFTLIAVITLALGIGANTAIFSVVNGVLLRPLPYKDPQQLVMVFAPRRLEQEFNISSGGFTLLRDQKQVFEQVAAFLPMLDSASITGDGEPEFLGGVTVSANLFTLLGVEARYGRTFLPEEEKPGSDRVVVISHRLWQRRFGSDQKIIGRTISLNYEPHKVVGVMPPGFQFPLDGMFTGWLPREIDIYIPLALTPEQMNNIDTPTAQSGGILASSEVACCCRSYARSTSVLLPVCPTAKLKNGSHDASSGVQPFGIKARHQRTLVFDTLTPQTSMHARCTTENSEFEERIVSKTRRCQIHPPRCKQGAFFGLSVIIYAFGAVCAAAQPSDGGILHKDLTGLSSFIRGFWNLFVVTTLTFCVIGAWVGYKRLSRNEAN